MRKSKRLRRLVIALIAIVAIWLIGDLAYSLYVNYRYAQWEQSVERDETGVLKNCGAYSIGNGKTAILLIHGINDSPEAYRKMAPALAGDGQHVRVMRLPGFGEPLDRYEAHSVADWTNAVDHELSQLNQTHDRVFAVAHSLGAAVLIRSLSRGTSVDGVVFLAPAIEVSNRRSPLFSTRFWHRLGNGLVFTNFVYNPFPDDVRDPGESQRPNRLCFTPRRVVDQTFELIDLNTGSAEKIEVPLLMVLSEHDQVIDSNAAERFFDSCGSDDKKLIWNNRAGHGLPYDLGWEMIVDETRTLIEQGRGAVESD